MATSSIKFTEKRFWGNVVKILKPNAGSGLLSDDYSTNRERMFRRSMLNCRSCSLLNESSFWA